MKALRNPLLQEPEEDWDDAVRNAVSIAIHSHVTVLLWFPLRRNIKDQLARLVISQIIIINQENSYD